MAIVNRKLGVGVAVHYNTREFPRLANWQHFAPYEYVTALEPANGSVTGRWNDRANESWIRWKRGAHKTYRYAIEVVIVRDARLKSSKLCR